MNGKGNYGAAPNRYRADLHIHSPYSRATSKASHLHGLAAWAAVKGLDVVGTGDFTHPGWLTHLLENLVEAEPGFFRLADTNPARYAGILPPGLEPDISGIRFVLTAELSSIYKRGGRVRKVHNILFVPDFDAVRRLNGALAAIGNLESDGRPILGLDSRDLLEILLEKAPEGFLVPAHIWTPWFSLFGSKSGFDSLEECFGDLSGHVFALETGLSSDPDMNRTISALDAYTLISNSDCHSPAKLGREANIFATGFDFFSMREAIRSPRDREGKQRFTATIEFYPEEGKYHCDGHRKCGVCLEPPETREKHGICPVCGKGLTVGVLHRVMELADRDAPRYPEHSPAVHSLVPLPELLSELLQVGPSSKKVTGTYAQLIRRFGSEFDILLERDPADLETVSGLLAESVRRVREGRVIRKPGYDGEFGVIRVFTDEERKGFGGQMQLFPAEKKKAGKKVRTTKKSDAGRVRGKGKRRKKNPSGPDGGDTPAGNLNPEQRGAVESGARHLIVNAGPGTGKTHTLVRRVARVAGETDAPCTVITFTNKAADEVRARLSLLLGSEDRVYVATLHGYCLRWLRTQDPRLAVAGPETRRRLLRRLTGNDRKRERELGEGLARFFRDASPGEPVPEQLRPYCSLLESQGMIDIDGVVPALAARLSRDDGFAATVREQTGCLFIDEFQDLNRCQYEVVRLLAPACPVFAIGDPDQAIYGFRGSSPQWFHRFIHDLRPEQHVLRRNYRSGGNIVRAANALISANPRQDEVAGESVFPDEGEVRVFRAATPADEAAFIVERIEELTGGTSHREIDRLTGGGERNDIGLRDIGVLYRTSRQADILARALSDHGFPVQVVDLRPFYLEEPLRVLHSWVQLGAGGGTEHLFSVLEREGASGSLVDELETILPQEGDLLTLLVDGDFSLSGSAREMVAVLDGVRRELLQRVASGGVTAGLRFLAGRYDISADHPDLGRLLGMAENFGPSLDSFALHLLHHSDSVVYDTRAEAVTLMTLHAAKGLEFKVVFVTGLEEGLLPLTPRAALSPAEMSAHIEEERRLFYVGMTRARDLLFLTHAAGRGKGEERQPSRFLKEIPPGLVPAWDGARRKKGKRKPRARQLSLFGKR